MFENPSAQRNICLKGGVVLSFLPLSFDNLYHSTASTKTEHKYNPNRDKMGAIWPKDRMKSDPKIQSNQKKLKEPKAEHKYDFINVRWFSSKSEGAKARRLRRYYQQM